MGALVVRQKRGYRFVWLQGRTVERSIHRAKSYKVSLVFVYRTLFLSAPLSLTTVTLCNYLSISMPLGFHPTTWPTGNTAANLGYGSCGLGRSIPRVDVTTVSWVPISTRTISQLVLLLLPKIDLPQSSKLSANQLSLVN